MEHREQEPPVNMGTEATMPHVGTLKPRLHSLMPPFELPSACDGRMVSPWHFKERQGLVLFFFDPRKSGDLEVLAELRRRYPQITDEDAEVFAIGKGLEEELKLCITSMDIPFPLLTDSDSHIHTDYEVKESTIFVVDKFGEIRMMSGITGDIDSILDSAIATLDLAELECPECGVSSWTHEDMDALAEREE